LWHNAFRDLITANAGAIEELLAASAPMLQASQAPALVHLGSEYAAIATSVKEALTVSRLIRPDLLGIELNALQASPQHAGKLLMARDDQGAERVGTMSVRILCPTTSELRNLRDGWNNWLRTEKNRQTARTIRNLYAGELEAGSVFAGGSNPIDLREWEGVQAYKGVTVPNVASTVLWIEEDGKSLLLTGDNHPDMIVKGLEDAGLMPDGHVHLDILKYPHHGSENNITKSFPRKVSADHYIFNGDGSHTNPELSVLEAMFASRLGPPAKRALAPVADGRPFKFWFSTSPDMQEPGIRQSHMLKVVDWAQHKQRQHPGQFSFEFSSTPFTTIDL
jgi:hypothetical protein